MLFICKAKILRKTSIFFVTIFLLASCLSRPDYVLDEDKMVEVLCEVHRSEGLLELQQSNSFTTFNEDYKKNVMAAVLVKQGITRAQYDSSLVWYGQNLNRLVKVYSRVENALQEEIDGWEEKAAERKSAFPISQAGDTVQIWTIQNYITLDESYLSSTRFWEMPTDSNYIDGDSLVWSLHVPIIPNAHYIVASMSLNYEQHEDSIRIGESNLKIIKSVGTYTLTGRTDKSKKFKSLIASVSLIKDSLNVEDETLFVDSLSLIRIHL